MPTDKGSAMAFKPGLIPRHNLFAPYAINRDGIVVAFDLSYSYDYLHANWYTALALKDWKNASTISTRTNIKFV